MAVVVVLLLGCVLGAINGLLVEVARIDSFIATLGTGTVLYAIALWYTEGRQVIGVLPNGFLALYTLQVFGIPIAAFYVLAIGLMLWIAAEFLPVGRCLYAIGANPRAAELNGIPTRRYVIGAFVASGLLGALAGIVLAAKLRIGQASGRAGVPAAGPGRRLPRLDHDQARPGQCLGHADRRRHPGRRHLRHPAAGRRLLCRAAVQRPDPAAGDRPGRLCPAQARPGPPPAAGRPRRIDRNRRRDGRRTTKRTRRI